MKLLIATLLLALSFCSAVQSTELPFFSVNYDATVKGLTIKATREYKPLSNGLMEFNFSATSLLASIDESTEFIWVGENIRPQTFNHLRTVVGTKREKQIDFDWHNNQITSTDKEKSLTIDNFGEALDRLSFQLQLQHDLLRNITTNTYRIADKDHIKEYRFEVMNEEILHIELGKIKTVKVKVDRASKKRVTYFWVAPDWYNLLVRLEQFKDGKKDLALELTGGVIGDKTIKLNKDKT